MSFSEQEEDFEVINTHQGLPTSIPSTVAHINNDGGSPTLTVTSSLIHSTVAVLKKQSVDNCEDPLSTFLMSVPSTHKDNLVSLDGARGKSETHTHVPSVITRHSSPTDTVPMNHTAHSSHHPINPSNYIHDNKNDIFMNFSSSKLLQSSLASKFTFLANTIQDAVQNATKGNIYPQSQSNPNSLQGSNNNNFSHTTSSASDNQQYSTVDGYGGMMHRSTSWNTSSQQSIPSNNNNYNSNNPTTRTSHLHSSSFKGSTSTSSIVSIPEMDNEKKNVVFSSAIGSSTLLPGERIIMFLSHLTFVRDSTSPRTGIGYPHTWMYEGSESSSTMHHDVKQSKDMVWCCAMTLYRLILFQYYESDFTTTTSEERDNSNSGGDEHDQALHEYGDDSSTTRNHSTTTQKEKKPRHVLVQMPLASIERLERTVLDISYLNNPTLMQANNGNTTISPFHNSSSSPNAQIPYHNHGTFLCLTVYGKDNGRFIRFATSSHLDTLRAYEALNTYAFPGRRNIGYLFAFESRREEVISLVQKNIASSSSVDDVSQSVESPITTRATSRWFDPLVEFHRMGIIPPSYIQTNDTRSQSCPWKFYSSVNKNYDLCSSYPSVLIGPSSVNDESIDGISFLHKVASFRSEGRLPSLTWCSRFDGASIWRSSQPKVGLQGNRSLADETFLKMIAEGAAASKLISNTGSTRDAKSMKPSVMYLKMLTGGINDSDFFAEKGNNCLLKIMDLRPKSSAMANRTGGYGYENTSNYFNTTITFHGIGNIHAVRDSYTKLSYLCTNPSVNDLFWATLVEETKWLQSIRLILAASWQVAFHVLYNRLPVLCHCSHGWDRTSQVVCVAQIFLDPYYRTRAGFCCLIEKDFLAFGHPFHTRCGHGEGRADRSSGGNTSGFDSGPGSGASDEAQISPVFIQFLDCVFQIVNQSPDDFEFNKSYLLLLSEHVYSCRFGTLMCDTEKEREIVASIRQRTYCLWEYLNNESTLLNPTYNSHRSKCLGVEVSDENALMIPLPSLLRNVVLWTDRHCMHGPKATLYGTNTSYTN